MKNPNPYKDITERGESVFLFHEEDSIWFGIFPDNVAEDLKYASEDYMKHAISKGLGEEYYDVFVDRREGLAYVEWEGKNGWNACTPGEIDVNDYNYVMMPDGTEIEINPSAKYSSLPLFALERGMITHYQGNHGNEPMTVREYMDHLESGKSDWYSM